MAGTGSWAVVQAWMGRGPPLGPLPADCRDPTERPLAFHENFVRSGRRLSALVAAGADLGATDPQGRGALVHLVKAVLAGGPEAPQEAPPAEGSATVLGLMASSLASVFGAAAAGGDAEDAAAALALCKGACPGGAAAGWPLRVTVPPQEGGSLVAMLTTTAWRSEQGNAWAWALLLEALAGGGDANAPAPEAQGGLTPLGCLAWQMEPAGRQSCWGAEADAAHAKERLRLLDALLGLGADVGGRMAAGGEEAKRRTPLLVALAGPAAHSAASAGFVAALLDAGADAAAADEDSLSPLHVAAALRPEGAWAAPGARTELVARLLKAGADPRALDGRGRLAVELVGAETEGADALVALLAA